MVKKVEKGKEDKRRVKKEKGEEERKIKDCCNFGL